MMEHAVFRGARSAATGGSMIKFHRRPGYWRFCWDRGVGARAGCGRPLAPGGPAIRLPRWLPDDDMTGDVTIAGDLSRCYLMYFWSG
jgi:hypothetical protein